MKTILKLALIAILYLSCLTGCNTVKSVSRDNIQHFTSLENYPKAKKMMVRLTTYSRTERHCDRNTRKGIASTGKHLVENQSVAVDPKIIPYNSQIIIPELKKKFIAVDTGGAVVSRKASRKTGRNDPIVDIFFNKEKDAKYFVENNPKVVEIFVVK